MTAMLSERIAKWTEYPEFEQAYLGGLLHDIGTLPLLVVAQAEDARSGEGRNGPWGGTLESEKCFFGMSHCEVGRWIGQFWNLIPSFIDVFENHHHPVRGVRDPALVGIVAAAEHFCESHALDRWTEESEPDFSATDSPSEDEFFSLCFPRLDSNHRWELTEMLESEYLHLLPVIEFNNSARQSTATQKV
jgi:HD-like signal output (HDOD) protein